MSETLKVLVKDSDMLSVKSVLHLLSSSIDGMKGRLTSDSELTEKNKLAISGAIEALTDLYNMILAQIQDSRNAETFDTSNDDHGGRFDA